VDNPWVALPDRPPYVLPRDREGLSIARGVHLDVLPVPYLGSPARAELYLLALNPGYGDEDVCVNERYPQWVEQQRKGLTFEAAPPFWALDSRFAGAGIRGYDWWTSRLGSLASVVGWDFIRERAMCIQYFPYRSRTYRRGALLPSQHFSFELVRDAVARRVTVVIMRSRKLWYGAVPELVGYPCHELTNPRVGYVSAGNMAPGAFSRLVDALLGGP
jgi:hypothetical protein